jgi:hypothetical protein
VSVKGIRSCCGRLTSSRSGIPVTSFRQFLRPLLYSATRYCSVAPRMIVGTSHMEVLLIKRRSVVGTTKPWSSWK